MQREEHPMLQRFYEFIVLSSATLALAFVAFWPVIEERFGL